MIPIVEKISVQDWEPMSENAHLIAFGKKKPASFDRIDFTLLVRTEKELMGYVTCREFDHETIYWQFGGAFPGTQSTSLSWIGYQAFVEWCKPRYKRITTLIENKNTVMLKMAMKVGFRVIGVRNFQGSILLEHLLEFSDAGA